MFFVAAVALSACGDKKRYMEVKNSSIILDGEPFIVASAEIDYARIPREYWGRELDRMAAMGLNTVTVKIPWMLHEPREGEFDFTGMNDVNRFCRMADERGLLVWLHIGPYVGAEWDMGGLPWWLLNVPNITLRSKQSAFMQRVDRYFAALGKELSPLLMSNGGNIAMVQVEEAQGLERGDKGYLSALCESAAKSGFTGILTFTAVTKESLLHTAVPEALFSIDINSEVKADEHFSSVPKFRYDAPYVCSSVGGDYKTVWGGERANRKWNKVFMRTFEMLQRGTSLSVNGMVNGTSFGNTAGASMADGVYRPYTTSHNSDGLLKVWGKIEPDFLKFRDTFYIYAQDEDKEKTEIPEALPLAVFPETEVTEVAPLFANLPAPMESEDIKTMEQCGMGYGAMLYSTSMPAAMAGTKLIVKGVHDYAQIFIDGKPLAFIDRRNPVEEIVLPATGDGAKLDILVDATGRVGDVKGYKDYKGITGGVELLSVDGTSKSLKGWKMYLMPSDYTFASSKKYESLANARIPGYYRVSFKQNAEGDMLLYMGNWGKGEVWLNGKSLGRFWNSGPQQTLYVPGCWLQDGANEIVIVDWIGPSAPLVSGVEIPSF